MGGPQGQGGPRRGGPGQGQGGRPSGRKGVRRTESRGTAQPRGAHGPASPYVMTTLTVPGAVPEGLPGTGHRGPRAGSRQGARDAARQRSDGPNRGIAAGRRRPGQEARPRQPQSARAERGATPGNGEPRAARPAEIDDDIGNRQPGARTRGAARAEARAAARGRAGHVDDDIGNRKPRERERRRHGNEVPRAVRPARRRRLRQSLTRERAASSVEKQVGQQRRAGLDRVARRDR